MAQKSMRQGLLPMTIAGRRPLIARSRRAKRILAVASGIFLSSIINPTIAFGQQPRPWIFTVMGMKYRTGNEVFCSPGRGLTVDVERRWGWPLSLGVGGGIRLADSSACADVGRLREVDGELLDEFARLSLMLAPAVGASVGSALTIDAVQLAPRVRANVLLARIDDPSDEHFLMPSLHGELALGLSRVSLLGRIGAVRALLLLETVEDGEWVIVEREWHWRRMIELGIGFSW